MNCQEIEVLIHAYIDGELDLRSALELEAHLGGCSVCTEAYTKHQTLQSAMRHEDLYFKPPPDMDGRIRHAISEADRPARRKSKSILLLLGQTPSRIVWLTASVAAAAALIAVMIWRPISARFSQDDLLAQEVLASHIRSLIAGHLTDILSSDQHTVKPWFAGKLVFSPPVADFSGQGFPLVGGRLDYLVDKPVAALIYQRRKHLISLFVWPSARDFGPKLTTRQGYHLINWGQSGMVFWAISDLNDIELQEFSHLVTGSH